MFFMSGVLIYYGYFWVLLLKAQLIVDTSKHKDLLYLFRARISFWQHLSVQDERAVKDGRLNWSYSCLGTSLPIQRFNYLSKKNQIREPLTFVLLLLCFTISTEILLLSKQCFKLYLRYP